VQRERVPGRCELIESVAERTLGRVNVSTTTSIGIGNQHGAAAPAPAAAERVDHATFNCAAFAPAQPTTIAQGRVRRGARVGERVKRGFALGAVVDLFGESMS
jgi:hypothetical protein